MAWYSYHFLSFQPATKAGMREAATNGSGWVLLQMFLSRPFWVKNMLVFLNPAFFFWLWKWVCMSLSGYLDMVSCRIKCFSMLIGNANAAMQSTWSTNRETKLLTAHEQTRLCLSSILPSWLYRSWAVQISWKNAGSMCRSTPSVGTKFGNVSNQMKWIQSSGAPQLQVGL